MTNLNTHLIRTVPTLAVRTDPAACRAHWVAWRNDNGVPTATAPELLTRPDHNVKLGKSAVPMGDGQVYPRMPQHGGQGDTGQGPTRAHLEDALPCRTSCRVSVHPCR
jgi:hypothetical protein